MSGTKIDHKKENVLHLDKIRRNKRKKKKTYRIKGTTVILSSKRYSCKNTTDQLNNVL